MPSNALTANPGLADEFRSMLAGPEASHSR
jgi:hypothetical protein